MTALKLTNLFLALYSFSTNFYLELHIDSYGLMKEQHISHSQRISVFKFSTF